ncbi:MAG TPA: carbohydrate ABC transporter permease, partial [Reyranella sp.]|nr:carbohydrate ABC transporter permease [Reyranella sp.]
MTKKSSLARDRFLMHALAIALAVLALSPFLWLVLMSFKTNAEIFTSPFALPQTISLANVEKVWTETNFVRYLANSVGVTAASVLLILVVGTMAA